MYQEALLKLNNSEKQITELNAMIGNLKQQLTIAQSSALRIQKNSPSTQGDYPKKKKNPPKLFCKIAQIINSKYMFLSVYLSFLDRKNTGFIEPEYLRKGIVYRGKVIKKKYVNEVLELISCNNRPIPIKLLEE